VKARYVSGEIGQATVTGECVSRQHVDAAAKMGEPSTASEGRRSEFTDSVFPQGRRAEWLATGEFAEDALE
jgi:hypothetical protein